MSPGTGARSATDRLPLLPRTFLPRARLCRRLDEATRGALTTVTAPAGAGKTMGVAGWLRDRARRGEAGAPPTWVEAAGLTADRFTEILRAAAGRRDGTAPWPPQEGPDDDAGTVGVVVVDDAERLDPQCVAVVDDLLDRAPRWMHLVLVSRWDVPVRRLLPTMLGTLTDVRGDVLRLDPDESAELVRRHAPGVPDDVVATIVERAQGWCAVVVLAARAAGPRGAAVDGAAAQGPLVSDLMAREVLESLTPRERHVVLSVCHGSGVTAEDACLAADDPGALDVLESMEQTGLLVQRDPVAAAEGVARFLVHPVLRDVVRRRFVTGGDDVEHARATIVRSSEIELARGRLGRALELAAVGGPERACELVATHGLLMVLRGEHAPVRAVVDQAGAMLRRYPAASLAVAVERWFADDAAGVGRWLEPLREPARAQRLDPTDAALAGLLCAQLGLEPPGPATRAAVELVRTSTGPVHVGRRALLLTLTGSAQTWLGDLRGAESSLSSAVLAARGEGAGLLEAVAVEDLALTEYLRGREQSAVELLSRATAPSDGTPAGDGARVPEALLRMHAEPWAFADAPPVDLTAPLSLGPVGAFCAWLARARSLALRGRAVEALIVLDTPSGLPRPRHLDVVVEVERALLAVANGDTDALGERARALHGLDAPFDEALARGFLAACRGELGVAARCLDEAAGAERSQPDTATLALVARAQVADALGAPADANALLGRALRRAEPRADALAFAGWLGHATPVHQLLARSGVDGASPWVGSLTAGLTAAGPLSSRVSSLSPSVHEARTTTALAVAPLLTTRERDVLLMLARGATYEDIGRSLYVTTNTVKTHVTNLYRKLGARTRSEALAAARSLFLL